MKKTLFLSVLLTSIMGMAQTNFTLDSNTQTINWIGKAALGNYAPEGTLTVTKGTILLAHDSIQNFSFEVDMKSLEQENTQLRDHLKEEDFFYVDAFPKATFVLQKSSTVIDGKATLIGNMTIRGITKEEIIEVSMDASEGATYLSFEHTMDRTRYGVNQNSPSLFKRLKENAIADEFVLKGSLRFQEELSVDKK